MEYGWDDNGEYNCPCGTMFGKNLLGESPHLLVSQHIRNCVPNARRSLELGNPSKPTPLYRYNEETWQQAIKEFMNPTHYPQ